MLDKEVRKQTTLQTDSKHVKSRQKVTFPSTDRKSELGKQSNTWFLPNLSFPLPKSCLPLHLHHFTQHLRNKNE